MATVGAALNLERWSPTVVPNGSPARQNCTALTLDPRSRKPTCSQRHRCANEVLSITDEALLAETP
jgi:hypothetical protein